MKNKTKVITWEAVFTTKQKKGIVDAVIVEINKLRRSPDLKKMLGDYLVLGEVGDFEDVGNIDRPFAEDYDQLKITRSGALLESMSYMDYGEKIVKKNQPVSTNRIRYLIEFFKITPEYVDKIRRNIER